MDRIPGPPSGDTGIVRSIPASVQIQTALREQIVSMQLLPGTPLSEKEITEAFGVSRTPVREALLRLAEERLVDVYPQVGTFVSRIRLDALKDAMVIREALERVAVREAAAKASKAGVAELRALIERLRATDRAEDLFAFYAADEEFHHTIACIAQHPNLWRVVKQEKLQVDRCRRLTLPLPGRRERVIAQHLAIAQAIEAGDPDRAEAAMRTHLADVLPTFDAVQRNHPDFFEPAAGASPASRPRRAQAARS